MHRLQLNRRKVVTELGAGNVYPSHTPVRGIPQGYGVVLGTSGGPTAVFAMSSWA